MSFMRRLRGIEKLKFARVFLKTILRNYKRIFESKIYILHPYIDIFEVLAQYE